MKQETEEPIIKVILVDDENAVRFALREILQKNFSYVRVIAEAANIQEAVREIHLHKPELVFLDIEMPGYSGLQLLDFFNPQEVTFNVIFVTAFDEYAIRAFKISAFDYLLKPINTQELEQTLIRYRGKKQKEKIIQQLELLKNSYSSNSPPTQIAISSLKGIDFIQLENIVLFEASGSYTTIIQKNSETMVASKPLGEFELIIQKNPIFFRSHRSYLINLTCVKKLLSMEGDTIILQNGLQIPLSRYRKRDFENAISAFKI